MKTKKHYFSPDLEKVALAGASLVCTSTEESSFTDAQNEGLVIDTFQW